jgi:hypothetical protein
MQAHDHAQHLDRRNHSRDARDVQLAAGAVDEDE